MDPAIVAVVGPLLGVVVGGLLAFLTQRSAQRAAERLERLRQSAAAAQARRAEMLASLDRFLLAAQAAEAVGVDRQEHGLDGADLHRRGDQAMGPVWIGEKTIRLLFSTTVHEATVSYAWGLHDTIFRDVPGNCWDYWHPRREAFLDAVRTEVTGLTVDSA